MSDAILIFTFSPIQPFIAEARRAADLYAGSKILVELARAAGQVFPQGTLVYPADLNQGDVPNKLVAQVPSTMARSWAEKAEKALCEQWYEIAVIARGKLNTLNPRPDQTWNDIWERQIDEIWEVYWAICDIVNNDYHNAYLSASQTLDAIKRTRVFEQAEETGLKDSLSGQRSALRTKVLDAGDYWGQIATHKHITRSQLRPGERLDARGAIKRFGEFAERFPSVSHIATANFLAGIHDHTALKTYRQTLQNLQLYQVSQNTDWSYDGDVLFAETLSPERLKSSYGLDAINENYRQAALLALGMVYEAAHGKPSPYYAIIRLDGDGMGELVNACTNAEAHRALSRQLTDFTEQVKGIAEKHHAQVIYRGGDDVLALSPLATALSFAQDLADRFRQVVVGGTASAGIAIAHHLYPLDVTLKAAHIAEKAAKDVPEKDAVCIRCLKRSGETLQVRSGWNTMGETFERLIDLFHSGDLSDRLAYSVLESAYALPEANPMFEAEVYRLLSRHSSREFHCKKEWAEKLRIWAATLPGQSEELGHWLTLARFMAMGGAE